MVGTGLCNQLFSFINHLLLCATNSSTDIKILILNNFCKGIDTNEYCSIDTIIDLKSIENIIKEYNINIFLTSHITNIDLIDAKYGINNNFINLVDILKTPQSICINKKTNINNLCKKDPCNGIPKKIVIKFKINDNIYIQETNELCGHIKEDIDMIFDINNTNNYKYSVILTENSRKHIEKFNNLFRQLKFNDMFYKIVDNFWDSIDTKYTIINIFHLRIEKDALYFWSKLNSMSESIFTNKLTSKYIYLINKYITKSDNELTIVLSASTSNNIIDYMISNNYNIIQSPKNILVGRELNAIVDLLISKKCNNVYIGNYNPITLTGSTFSYGVSTIITNQIKRVTIDLDHIDDDEYTL